MKVRGQKYQRVFEKVAEKLSPTNPVQPDFPGGNYQGDSNVPAQQKYGGDNPASQGICQMCQGTGICQSGPMTGQPCPYCANQPDKAGTMG